MNISGVIVHARPDQLAAVQQRLTAIAGVEVHAASNDGKLVVTVEEENDRILADTVLSLRDVPGVLSASMVYHQYDEGSI